jgi:acetyl-CoA carboxylase biotin carboxyl carrier protein
MTLDEIKHLIEFIRQHELSEFELERDGFKLRVKSGSGQPPFVMAPSPVPGVAVQPSPAAVAVQAPVPTPGEADATDETGTELAIVKSPIVGTFYRAPEPGAPAFVEVGSTVQKGQVLCIIEAMKLMNEIDSEYDGEIANIYVEGGQPVQYGERLFAIRLKGGSSPA